MDTGGKSNQNNQDLGEKSGKRDFLPFGHFSPQQRLVLVKRTYPRSMCNFREEVLICKIIHHFFSRIRCFVTPRFLFCYSNKTIEFPLQKLREFEFSRQNTFFVIPLRKIVAFWARKFKLRLHFGGVDFQTLCIGFGYKCLEAENSSPPHLILMGIIASLCAAPS